MKRYFTIILLLSLSFSAKPDLPKPLLFNYQNVSMRQVLENLSNRIGVRFVFYDQLVENRPVSCRFSSRSVTSILNRIILPQGLLYERTSENVFTLYQRVVPPHTWILQGQVLSADSTGIENGTVFLTELSSEVLTDVQGCFVFMDIPASPCQILITHPEFESIQRSVDSTQVYQVIVLRPRQIERTPVDSTGMEIRTIEERTPAIPLPEENFNIRPAKVWPQASFLSRTGYPLVSLYSPLSQGTDPFSCAGVILYDGIPWFVNACAFEMTGFHTLNTGNIHSGINPDGCSLFCEQINAPIPDRRVSGTAEWEPWQVKGRFLWSGRPELTLFVALGRTVFLSKLQPFYEHCEEYQQLIRYRSIRPAQSPLYQHSDFSSKIEWNAYSSDRFSLTLLRVRDRLNTAYSEAVLDPETMTDQTAQTGARLAWQHLWGPSSQSGAEAVLSENRDRYLYENEPLLSGKFTDRADFSTGYAQITHQQSFSSWWQVRLAGGFAQTNSAQKVETAYQTLAAMNSERKVFYINARQHFAPSVLLQGIVDTGVRYDPDTHTAVYNPALTLKYRIRQCLTLGAELAEMRADWLSVPNQYLTDQPWRVRTFRLASGSDYPAERIRRFVLSLESTAPSVHAALFYHELTGLLYGTSSTMGILHSDDSPFLTGSGNSYGSQVETELEGNAFDIWISYRWTKTRHHFHVLNGNRDFIPEWHRDHVIRGVMQASPLNLDLRLTGIWASGSVFIRRSPVYQMTAYGPDFRLSLPSGAWETDHSPSYFRMDCSVSKRIFFKGSELTLGATLINLLNRANVIGPYYFLESADANAELPRTFLNMPDLPRMAYFTVRVRFFR